LTFHSVAPLHHAMGGLHYRRLDIENLVCAYGSLLQGVIFPALAS